MSEIINIFKKPLVVIILGLLVTVAAVGSTGYFFVLPQFNSLGDNQNKTADLTAKLADLTKNINTIKSIEQGEISKYSKTLDSLFPVNSDYLHFATLNDNLASIAGLKVTSFTVSSAPKTSVPAATASGSNGGTSAAVKQQAATSPTTSTAVGSGYNVVVAYTGSFDKIESLLKNLHNLDRIVGVNHITFSAASSDLAVSITYFLPLSSSSLVSASSDTLVTLSTSDKSLLDKLAKNIQFTAAPADNSLGKPNPFQ